MIKVFVGNKSLLRQIFIRFTAVTFCEDTFSHISSSLIPSRSLHLITPFEKLREECGVTLTGMLQKVFDFRRQLECFSLVHSTNSPILIFLTDFGSPAKPTIAFWTANGDNLVKAPSSVELIMRNLGQLVEITFVLFSDFVDSSSEDDKPETSVWTLFRVPSEFVFIICFDMFWI